LSLKKPLTHGKKQVKAKEDATFQLATTLLTQLLAVSAAADCGDLRWIRE
jgi:hypothetical protein